MPNHVHILWRKQDLWLDKSIQQQFLKYTAQQIKFNLILTFGWCYHQPKNNHPYELENFRSSQTDRNYHFWERRPFMATMNDRKVFEQKLDYTHHNPVRKGLCDFP